jgi:hypothetical protein
VAETIHEGQAVLFATRAAGDGFPILAAIGDAVREDIEYAGGDVRLYIPADDLPKAPGFYAWEGHLLCDITHHDEDDNDQEDDREEDEEEAIWIGTVRPATLADLARFGFPAPGGSPGEATHVDV